MLVCVPTMTERCSLWSALSAAACCFYRGSFMQVQVSLHPFFCVVCVVLTSKCVRNKSASSALNVKTKHMLPCFLISSKFLYIFSACLCMCMYACVWRFQCIRGRFGSSPVPAAGNVRLPALAGRLMIS